MNETIRTDEETSDPRWGSDNRQQKAENILQCLTLLTDLNLRALVCVDIGCGSGAICAHMAPSFKQMVGVDPESWERWQDYTSEFPTLSFREESIENLSLPDDSVDVVICNQVYEHVPSPEILIAQIYRILKPGGLCYFAGPNLLYPVEPHVHWPFIHWIPRRLALAILRSLAPDKVLDAYSTTYWQLRRWLGRFTIVDAVPQLIKYRAESTDGGNIWRVFRYVPLWFLRALGFLSPGFIFIVSKPADPSGPAKSVSANSGPRR